MYSGEEGMVLVREATSELFNYLRPFLLSLPLHCTAPEILTEATRWVSLLFTRLCLSLSSSLFLQPVAAMVAGYTVFKASSGCKHWCWCQNPMNDWKPAGYPSVLNSDSIQVVLECFPSKLLTYLILNSAPTLPFPSSDPAVFWPSF